MAWSRTEEVDPDTVAEKIVQDDSKNRDADLFADKGVATELGIEWEAVHETDALCSWLARFPVQNNTPRPLVPRVVLESGVNGVMVVAQDDLVVRAFRSLTAGGFLGCPVVDAFGVYVDQLDLLDLVFFVCRLFKAHYDDELDAFYVPASPVLKKRWIEFFQVYDFRLATVDRLLHETTIQWDGSNYHCFPSYVGCSSLGVLEQMARFGSHRVAILTDEGRVYGLMTQSMFISLFSQQMERLGALRRLLVSDLIAYLAAIPHVVNEESLAINAFKLMARYKISGLGVVDADGGLVGSISVSDLHNIGCEAEHFERLWYPVKRFMQDTAISPSTVVETDTLETVIRRMEDGYVHLVFVVEKANEVKQVPLHAITQRDVLRIIANKMGMGPM